MGANLTGADPQMTPTVTQEADPQQTADAELIQIIKTTLRFWKLCKQGI